MSHREFYENNGFVLIRQLLTTGCVAEVARKIKEQAKLAEGQHLTAPDAVNRFPQALEVLTGSPLLASMRGIMNDRIKFLQLADLHQSHNADGWHRDSVNRNFGRGEDWNEAKEQYDVAKLILYLEVSKFGLGVVARSHRADNNIPESHRDFAAAHLLTDEDIVNCREFEAGKVVLISPSPGDAILFDERLLHCGRPYDDGQFAEKLLAPKMTLCWVFGRESKHAHRFHSYFRFVRANYDSFVDEVRARLNSMDLLPSFIDANYFHDYPHELQDIFFSEPFRMAPAVRDHGIGSGAELYKLYENNARLMDLQSLHEGETVYVVGSGPSLGRLQPEWRAQLAKCLSIGLNRSTYLVPTHYFTSAYISECLLARMQEPAATCINLRPVLTTPLVEGILTAKRVYSEEAQVLAQKFNFDEPTVFTRNNVMFAATHLALIMGAKRICYVGIEQRNGLHFFNGDDECRERMFNDLIQVITENKSILGLDHPYERAYEMLRRLFESPRDLATRPFYDIDHTDLLARWHAFARDSMGVTIVSTVADSVAGDAGIPYQPLAHAIEQEWRRKQSGYSPPGIGHVDVLEIDERRITFHGWAVDLIAKRPIVEVMLMLNDDLLLRVKPDMSRPDVAANLANEEFMYCGFSTTAERGRNTDRMNRAFLRAYGKTADGSLCRLGNLGATS